jgi:hypothetical protein
MSAIDTSRRKLDLGRVFGDTAGVIRRQAVPLLGVTFVRPCASTSTGRQPGPEIIYRPSTAPSGRGSPG